MILRCIWVRIRRWEPMEPILAGRSHLDENTQFLGHRIWRTWRICILAFNKRREGVHFVFFPARCSILDGLWTYRMFAKRGKVAPFFFLFLFSLAKLHQNSMELTRRSLKMEEYCIEYKISL